MRDKKYSKNRKLFDGSEVRSSKIVSFFVAFLTIIFLFSPVVVYAEGSPTYFVLTAGNPITYNGVTLSVNTGEVRGCLLNGRPALRIYFVGNTANYSQRITFTDGSSTSNGSLDAGVQVDNVIYNYGFQTIDGLRQRWINGALEDGLFTTVVVDRANDTNAVYYTYGGGAVDPAPPINWGNPADVNISTIYSGNVQNSPSNIDKFTWDNSFDSNGISYISHLDEHPVIEVQAVPVTWKTSTREEMENNSGGDPTIGTGVPLDSYNARTGHLEVTWQEVIDYLQIEYADIYSYFFDGTYWIMKGWFYQIRLVTDNYTGEWITLSNGLNLTPKKSKKLIEDPYDETIYNILKEISENNNQETTVYEYGDNYITINTDPSSGWQDPDGGGSFWDFLASVVKAISDGIASIVSSVASLVGDLVNGILGLFTFDTFEINNYNTEVQTLKDNSGIFGQSIEFADSIKDSIRGVEQQPAVLHFDGIVIDDVQLIPAVDLDFDQMVVDAGLTDFHNLVYVFTDGTILISLIIMVHRKVMEVLRK